MQGKGLEDTTPWSMKDQHTAVEFQRFFSDLMIFHQKERLREVIESYYSHGHIY